MSEINDSKNTKSKNRVIVSKRSNIENNEENQNNQYLPKTGNTKNLNPNEKKANKKMRKTNNCPFLTKVDGSDSDNESQKNHFEHSDDDNIDVNSLLHQKGSSKILQMLDMEKAKALKSIKEQHRPLDFDKLKQHERSYMAEMYLKKEQKKEELTQNLKKLSKSYDVKYKSKKYNEIKDQYMFERNQTVNKKEDFKSLKNVAKKYAQKVTEQSGSDKLKLMTDMNTKFPDTGDGHTKWFYGRFAKNILEKSLDIDNNKKLPKQRKLKGQEYLNYSKLHRVSNQILKIRREREMSHDNVEKEEELQLISKRRSSSNDYLKELRANRLKLKSNDTSKTQCNTTERSINQNFKLQSGETLDDTKANFIINRFNNWDNMIKRQEEKIKFMNPVSNDKTLKSLLHKNTQDCLDDYYLKAIKAKLSFQDDI